MTKAQPVSAAKKLPRNDQLELVDTLIASVDLAELRKVDKAQADKIEWRIGEILRRRTTITLADQSSVEFPM